MSFFHSSSSNFNSINNDDNGDFFSANSQDNSKFFSTARSILKSQFSTSFTSQEALDFEENDDFIISNHNEEIDSSQSTENHQTRSGILNFENSILFSDEDSSIEDEQGNDKIDPNLITQYSAKISQKTSNGFQIFPATLETSNNDMIEDFGALPKLVIQIYKDIKENYSDYTFTSILASQLCSEIFPFGSYNNLKMALLMSVIAPQDKNIHIMAICQETSHACIIMNSIGKYAKRFLRITSNFDSIIVNNNTIEGGPISLASSGVAFIGNWQRIPQKTILKLLREIETKIIFVDKIQKNFPFQTTIWSYWNFTSKLKKDLASISQFINIFGIPIIVDDNLFMEDIMDDFLNQTLTEPYSQSNDFQLPENDFRLYLKYASSLTVEFDSSADDMVKNYFMATKIVRPDAFSEKGYDTLKLMAESHAKLSLRKTVTCQDVLAAISIAEKFIKEFFETDSFTSPSFNMETASIDCYDKYINDLHEWYLKFTKDILEKM